MNNGYQQFFKKAQQVAETQSPLEKLTLRASRAKSFQSLDDSMKPLFKSSPKPRKKSDVPKKPAEILRDRAKLRMQENRRRKRFPLSVVIALLVGAAVAGMGLTRPAKIEKFVKNLEISMMSVADAEEAKTDTKSSGAEKDKTPNAEKTPEKKDEAKSEVGRKNFSEDEVNHFGKLNERKLELDAREAELNRLESELAGQKEAMEKRLAELESTRRQISSVLQDKVQADDKKVEALVQVYSNMKPQQAAKIFETMDEDLAIEILGRMKKKPAAEILNLVKAEKAQILSEKYAGYKKK
jgi:flagellar motility protein MotE (MotC chaperone)